VILNERLPLCGDGGKGVGGSPIRLQRRFEGPGQFLFVSGSKDVKEIRQGLVDDGALARQDRSRTRIAGEDEEHGVVFPFERP
jgi:hypothetical protein